MHLSAAKASLQNLGQQMETSVLPHPRMHSASYNDQPIKEKKWGRWLYFNPYKDKKKHSERATRTNDDQQKIWTIQNATNDHPESCKKS